MITPDDKLFVDLDAIDTGVLEWPVRRSIEALLSMYENLDKGLHRTTSALPLPCKDPRSGRKHCADCCQESVYLTGLEWLAVVDYAQTQLAPALWHSVAQEMLQLYHQHSVLITQIQESAEPQRSVLAKQLRYKCPLLDDVTGCRVYPVREMLGRLFGQSVNKDGGIYGCSLSGAFFAGRELSLLSAEGWSRQLRSLPLTHSRHVYPYWFFVTYGDKDFT